MSQNPFDKLTDQLSVKFGAAVMRIESEAMDPWIEAAPASLPEICRYLKDDPDLRFDLLNCITVIDYCHTDPKKAAKAEWEPHLELVYHLSSTVYKTRLVLKASVPRWQNGVEGDLPEVPTVTTIWRTAEWHEREVYDLSGVRFVGHPQMQRILCSEDWVGHPLRKDYEMPTEYHGIRLT